MDITPNEAKKVILLNNRQEYGPGEDGFDDDHVAAKEGRILPQVVASLVMASYHISMGFSLGYSAILIPQLENNSTDIIASKTETAWIASTMVLLVPVGALCAGILMEYLGRVTTIQIGAIPCILGWCLIALSPNVTTILVGRILLGIAAGMGSSPAIVYVTEVASPKLRGMLISTCPGLASLGILLAYTEGAFLQWRYVAWTGLIYIIIPTCLVRYFVPESPVWLVAKGRVDDAGIALSLLAGNKGNAHVLKLAAMVKSRDLKALVTKNFGQRLYKAFLQPTGYKPLLILFCLFFFQQFSGVYITLFYATTFFQDVGSGLDPSIATILVGCTRFFMGLFNTALMRRCRRRPLYIVSCLGMTFFMVISGFFTKRVLDGEKQYSWVPVACVLLYVCSSMIGLMSIPWTMTAEFFPTEIRGIAHGLVISVAHVLMFLAVQLYRPLMSLLGGAHAVQWFFASICIAAALFVWLFLPETHNKELADIELYFKTNILYILAKNSGDKASLSPTVICTPMTPLRQNNINTNKEEDEL